MLVSLMGHCDSILGMICALILQRHFKVTFYKVGSQVPVEATDGGKVGGGRKRGMEWKEGRERGMERERGT